MRYTFDTEVFFFNAQTDYLPYYKHFRIEMDGAEPLKALLAEIRRRNDNFAYPNRRLLVRVNGVVCNGEESLDSVALKLGTSLKIEPASAYRSTHCLVMNDDDFKEAYATVEAFCDEEDKAFFDKLYALHYASATYEYDKSYKGDALIALAHHLVKKYPEKADAIVEAVKKTLDMCEYENALFEPYDLQPALEALRAHTAQKQGLVETLKARFYKEGSEVATPKAPIHDGGVAIYGEDGDEAVASALKAKGARLVTFAKATRKNGRSILKSARELALRKAAAVLLDAFDNGATTLVCTDDADARYFLENFKAITRAAGRDIPLRVTSAEALGLKTAQAA